MSEGPPRAAVRGPQDDGAAGRHWRSVTQETVGGELFSARCILALGWENLAGFRACLACLNLTLIQRLLSSPYPKCERQDIRTFRISV